MSIIPLTENFQNDFEFLRKKSPTPLVFRRALHAPICRKYDLATDLLGVMRKLIVTSQKITTFVAVGILNKGFYILNYVHSIKKDHHQS